MSDYMFMLESRLSGEQNRAVALIQQLAAEAGVSVYLTGGAVRDLLGHFPIRDLDFTVEGPALKIAKTLIQKHGATLVSQDDARKAAELLLPGPVHVQIAMARQERYPKPGGKPQIAPALLYDDLRCRDFTINALALSLNRASRGLLVDPTNGLGDLERRELRVVQNTSLYDDPARLLRLIRLQVRMGFSIEERTLSQYRNVREAGMEKLISAGALRTELLHAAEEPNPADLWKRLAEEGLSTLFSPALSDAKLNLAGLSKLHKVRQSLPFGIDLHVNQTAIFLNVLTENFSPKDRAALVKLLNLGRAQSDAWQKLPDRAKKLERELKGAKLQKPSNLYQALIDVPGELVLYLLMNSQQRIVQDRIKNYLNKYLPAALEVTDAEVAATGVPSSSPKFAKAKLEFTLKRLDSRPKKVAQPEESLEIEPTGPGRRA